MPVNMAMHLLYCNTNNFTQARDLLAPLLAQNNNLYFQIAMAQAETGLSQHQAALSRLAEMQNNYPDNYAVLDGLCPSLISCQSE